MSRTLRVIALVVLCLACEGCYRGRVVAFQPPKKGEPPRDVPEGTFDKTQKVDLYFWGLLQKPQSPVLADCVTDSMKEVTVTRKAGYVAAAVFTFGIYSAIDISWQCAVQPSKQGKPIGSSPPPESTPSARMEDHSHADR